MKIFFLGDSISTQQAGIHYFGKQLVQNIIHSYPQHDYTIICTKPIEGLEIRQKIIPVGFFSPLRWRQWLSIPAWINRELPDMVIELAHFGPFRLSKSIKKVTVIHDLTPLLFPKYHPFLSVLAHRWLLPGIMKRATYLIVNSEKTANDVVQLYAYQKEKIAICFPFHHPFSAFEKPKVENPYGQPYFLTVGTLEPRKNHLTILRAFEKFALDFPEYLWVITGKPGWKNQEFFSALSRSPQKNRIVLTGYLERPDLFAHYFHAQFFVFASFYEGLGLPILEALEHGLPLILSDNGCLPTAWREAALKFSPKDSQRLYENLIQLASDQKTRVHYLSQSREVWKNTVAQQEGLDQIFGIQKDISVN